MIVLTAVPVSHFLTSDLQFMQVPSHFICVKRLTASTLFPTKTRMLLNSLSLSLFCIRCV